MSQNIISSPRCSLVIEKDGRQETINILDIKKSIQKNGNIVYASWKNPYREPVKIRYFRFILNNRDNIFCGKPDDFRFYKEAWSMPSAIGSLGLQDRDFEYDRSYIPFGVSDHKNYSTGKPGFFTAEYMAILQNKTTGMALLAGFVTAREQYSTINLRADGNENFPELEARSLGDGISLAPGKKVQSEKLLILTGSNHETLIAKWLELLAKNMKARTSLPTPVGWCSWYHYFSRVTEQDIKDNIAYLAAHRDEIPVDFIQIDDGYQKALGDWLLGNEKFPGGMKQLAAEIKTSGFRPGIWLAPFSIQEGSTVHLQHPEWLVRDSSGNHLELPLWRGEKHYLLDCTNNDALHHLNKLFRTLCDWGYDYFKLDFMVYESHPDAVYGNPQMTRAMAFRRGLEEIRRAVGRRTILACTSPLGPAIGIADAFRIATDITPYWQKKNCIIYKEAPTVFNVCRNIINRSCMHRVLWVNDPDCLIVRAAENELTLEEVRTFASAVILSGGSLVYSDKMDLLTPERLAIIQTARSLMTDLPAYPVDRMENEYPRIWLRTGSKQAPALLGVFNWLDNAEKIHIPFAKMGFNHAIIKCREIWTGQTAEFKNSINNDINIAGHACMLFEIL